MLLSIHTLLIAIFSKPEVTYISRLKIRSIPNYYTNDILTTSIYPILIVKGLILNKYGDYKFCPYDVHQSIEEGDYEFGTGGSLIAVSDEDLPF